MLLVEDTVIVEGGRTVGLRDFNSCISTSHAKLESCTLMKRFVAPASSFVTYRDAAQAAKEALVAFFHLLAHSA